MKIWEHWHQYLNISWEREWRDQYPCFFILEQIILSCNLVPMLVEKGWKTTYFWNAKRFIWVRWGMGFSLSVFFPELSYIEGKSNSFFSNMILAQISNGKIIETDFFFFKF